MESKQSFWGTMYVICCECDEVVGINECHKFWNSEKDRYPTHICLKCRNEQKESIQEREKIYAI
jgi:hypothetical protein